VRANKVEQESKPPALASYLVVSFMDLMFKCKLCGHMLYVDFSVFAAFHFPYRVSECPLELGFDVVDNVGIHFIKLALFGERRSSDWGDYGVKSLESNMCTEYACPFSSHFGGEITSYDGLIGSFFVFMSFYAFRVVRTIPRNVVLFLAGDDSSVDQFTDRFIIRASLLYRREIDKAKFRSDVKMCDLNDGISRTVLMMVPLSEAIDSFASRTDLFYGDSRYPMGPQDVRRVRHIISLLRRRILTYTPSSYDGNTCRQCHMASVSLWCCKTKYDELCGSMCFVNDVACLHPSLLAWSCCTCCSKFNSFLGKENAVQESLDLCVVGKAKDAAVDRKSLVELYLAAIK